MADPVSSSVLQQMAAQYTTPQAVPAIQRSQYLAQALQNMQDTAKQGIKSPTQLWTTLLADGLIQSARAKSDRDLAGVVQAGQGAQTAQADAMMGLGPSDASPAPAAPQVQPSAFDRVGGLLSHLLGGGSPQTAPGAPQAGPDPQLQAIINAPPVSAGNFGTQGPVPAPQAPAAPQMAPAPSQAAQAPQQGPVPTPAAVPAAFPGAQVTSGFRSPMHNAAVGGVSNSWHTMGTPDNPGAVDLVPPRGVPMAQFAQAVASQYPQARILNEGTHLHVQPNQANTGQMPPPAPSPSGAVGAPPPAIAPPVAGTSPPAQQQTAGGGMPGGPPTGPGATPQEIALYHQLIANPMTRQQGLEFAAKIGQRSAAPIELNKDEYFDRNGQAQSLHALQQVQGGPQNAIMQMDPLTHQITMTNDPSYGSVPAGARLTANGIQQLPGSESRPLITPQERAAYGIQPTDRNVYNVTPQGKIEEGPKDPFGPSAQLDYTQKATADERYKNYIGARQNLTAMQDLMKQKGGFSDLALLENGGKTINPTIAIRPNMLEAMYGSQGLTDNIIGEIRGVVNHGGRLSPEARQAVYNAAQANVKSHWDALGPLLGKVDYDAKRFGVTRQDLLPDLQPLPEPFSPSYGDQGGNAAKYGPDPIAAARNAIARGAPRDAVIKQMQADGIPTGGL